MYCWGNEQAWSAGEMSPSPASFSVTAGAFGATPTKPSGVLSSNAFACTAVSEDGRASSRASATATPPSAVTTPTTPGRPKLCKFYAMGGGCTKGAHCPFSHELSVRASSAAAAKAGFVFVTGVANIQGAANVESPDEHQRAQSTQPGLNPTARAFDFVPFVERDENRPDDGAGNMAWGFEQQQAYHGASDHLVGHPQEGLYTASYRQPQPHHQHSHQPHFNDGSDAAGQGYHDGRYDGQQLGADSHYHAPHGGYGGGYGDQGMCSSGGGFDPQSGTYTPNAMTPPTFTERRRVPLLRREDAEMMPQPAFDYAARQAQAMRPPLELHTDHHYKDAPHVSPTARPRPPLQTLGNSTTGTAYHHRSHQQPQHQQQSEHFVPWQGVY
jgi:hypothetical protein